MTLNVEFDTVFVEAIITELQKLNQPIVPLQEFLIGLIKKT